MQPILIHRALRAVNRHRVLLGFGALALGAAVISGCASSVPHGINPVANFNVQRYAGTWYEIARIDHSFEKGLINTTGTYSLNPDGTLKVVNRGYDPARNAWKETEGKAKFAGSRHVGALKVSFFGPFYGGYNIVHLSDDYLTSMVIGDSPKFLWILSRSKTVPEDQMRALLSQAQTLGVDTSAVIRVPQD